MSIFIPIDYRSHIHLLVANRLWQHYRLCRCSVFKSLFTMKKKLITKTLAAVILFCITPLVSALFSPESVRAQPCTISTITVDTVAMFTQLDCGGVCPNMVLDQCIQDLSAACGPASYKMAITTGNNFCCLDSITITPSDTTLCWAACVAVVGTPLMYWSPAPIGCTEGAITYYGGNFCSSSTVEFQFCENSGPMTFTITFFSGSMMYSFPVKPGVL